MSVVIKRTQESEYKLLIDGDLVKTYNQTVLSHPWDWAADARDAGVSGSVIEQRKYEYKDVR